MRLLIVMMFFCLSIAVGQTADNELVNVRELIPDIVLDIKYNTTQNFTSQKLYTTDECFLVHAAARALQRVQDSLRTMGKGLKIFDGYRPRAVQYLMWEIYPVPGYVADPATGSNHNRGTAVDLTIVDLVTKQELEMGTPFDYFGPEAGYNYTPLPGDATANRRLLRGVMVAAGGFSPLSTEWWHFDYAPGKNYPLLDFQLR